MAGCPHNAWSSVNWCAVLVLYMTVVPTDQHQEEPPVQSTGAVSRKLSVLLIAGTFTSHQLPLVALGEELVRRGHSVTMMAPVVAGSSLIPDLAKGAGVRFIASAQLAEDPSLAMSRAANNATSFLDLMYKLIKAAGNSTEDLTGAMYKLQRMNGSDWDYVVVDFLAGILHQYIINHWGEKAMISYSPLPIAPATRPPWPHPSMFSPYTSNMNFMDRLINTAVYWPLEWTGQSITRLFFTYVTWKLEINVSMPNMWTSIGVHYPVIFHTVFGFEYPKTRYPLQHYVGPIVTKNPRPIDKSLENWLADKGSDTVVYISMGSSGELTPQVAGALLTGVLSDPNNYSIVWALRESNRDCLDGLQLDQNRVFVSGWVSQISMLQHRATAVAILHCGLNSVQEALLSSIPVICVPYAWDQFDIAVRLSSQGLGVRILANELSLDNIRAALHTVRGRDIQDKVKIINQLFKISGGVDTAADLVELYASVGHDHGIPAFVRYDWSWVQYYNADVWLVILALVGVLGWVCARLCHCWCCWCVQCCCSSKVKHKPD